MPLKNAFRDNVLFQNIKQALKLASYWPQDLLGAIACTINTPYQPPSEYEFRFRLDQDSAAKNSCILNKCGQDLERAIWAQAKFHQGCVSEFRPTGTLAYVISKYPHWSRMKHMLENGSTWHLEELEECSRWMDLDKAVVFGKHTAAERHPQTIKVYNWKGCYTWICIASSLEQDKESSRCHVGSYEHHYSSYHWWVRYTSGTW